MFTVMNTTPTVAPTSLRSPEDLEQIKVSHKALYDSAINLRIGSAIYTIDIDKLFEAAGNLLESDFSTRSSIDSIMQHVVTEVANTRDFSRHMVFYSQIRWDPVNWPVEGAFPGAYIVVGDTDSGKTFYMRNQANVDYIIRWGEPNEDVDNDNGVITVTTFEEMVTYALVLGVAGAKVGVDSLRNLVYSSSGNTIEGGMSAVMFDVATNLSNVFASLGVSAFLVINPLLSDPIREKRLYNRIASSAAGAVHIVDRSIAEDQFRTANGRISTAGTRTNNNDDETQEPTFGSFTNASVAYGSDDDAAARVASISSMTEGNIDVDTVEPPRVGFPRLDYIE